MTTSERIVLEAVRDAAYVGAATLTQDSKWHSSLTRYGLMLDAAVHLPRMHEALERYDREAWDAIVDQLERDGGDA
jgi:hypothetical protein